MDNWHQMTPNFLVAGSVEWKRLRRWWLRESIIVSRWKLFTRIFLSTLENLIKYWPEGLYNFIKINPGVTGGITLIDIGYKYNYRKILSLIAAKGDVSNEQGDPYLSRFPNIYYNVSVCPIVRPHFPGRYFNACNSIDNHNRM